MESLIHRHGPVCFLSLPTGEMILTLLGIHSLLLLLVHQGLAGDPLSVAKELLAEQPEQHVNNRVPRSSHLSYRRKKFMEKFLDELVIPLPPDVYCNILIRSRNVMISSSPCKKEHYFIHSSWDDLQHVCENDKFPCKNSKNNCYQSTEYMDMTVCQLLDGDEFPYCEYTSVKKKKKVVLSCKMLKDSTSLFPDSVEAIVD
ncbi:inactive ribonuclease-like protein 9 [Trichosurus vulpecula]|uniref:inactive ribonuclease-like protein 9 n=1 Tax=Trichosurus vulpecula TaxID=9337 RepID=UPI00186AC79A|nr:inactive ribonuclease-like protein 9 [Trichosurus vulpecula]